MKRFLSIITAVLVSMTIASAQTIPSADSTVAASIEITTTFRARIEGADPRNVPPATAQDAARRTLYNMAANECTLIAEFWKAECRLKSISVYLALADIASADLQVPSMFGTAVYELKLTSPSGR